LVQKSLMIILIFLIFFPTLSVFGDTKDNKVSAILTAKIKIGLEENGPPISNARVIVIDSFGEVIESKLTNKDGEAKIPITINKDPRFPMKNMGEVTVIAVANGFNEYIDFSVPINENNDNSGRVFIPLWKIDPISRNEPQFINGRFHRFTVFTMLDYYAEKFGLIRQELNMDIGKEPPWSPELKKTEQ
jgi:hypothetical protein